MPSLFTLIACVVLAAGAMAAVWGAVAHVEGIGAKKVETKYAGLIAQCNKEGVSPDLCATEWTQALVENQKQASAIRDITQGAKACSDETEQQKKDTAKDQAAKDRGLAKAKIQIDELTDDAKLSLQFALMKRPPGEKCETTLGKIDTRMRDLAARELRDRSAEAIRDGPGGGNPQDPGDTSMHITK